jgi:hypothetical protein
MRPESIENTPAPGVAEGAGPAGAGSPAGSPEAGAPSFGGMSPELRTKWEEFVEEEKRKYIIEVFGVSVEEDRVVFNKLEMKRIYFPIYPYGNYVETLYEIEWDGADTIVASAKCVHDSWGGTGCEPFGKLTIEVTLPETPWFFDYGELAKRIEKDGVKETIESIVENVLYLAKVALGEEE